MSDQFRKDLASIINRHSKENGSDTPDFMLAEYLADCLELFDRSVKAREKWYGRAPQLTPSYEHPAEPERPTTT